MSRLPPAAPHEIERVGHEDHGERREDHHRGGRALADLAALEHEVVDVGRGERRRDAGAGIGERDGEVEGLDRELQQHHRDGEEDRRDRRQDHLAIGAEPARAVDLGGLDDVVVDRAKPGEEQRHREARGGPDAGDDDRPDGVLAVGGQRELEVGPAPAN